jgi:hypothetical protein
MSFRLHLVPGQQRTVEAQGHELMTGDLLALDVRRELGADLVEQFDDGGANLIQVLRGPRLVLDAEAEHQVGNRQFFAALHEGCHDPLRGFVRRLPGGKCFDLGFAAEPVDFDEEASKSVHSASP